MKKQLEPIQQGMTIIGSVFHLKNGECQVNYQRNKKQ